MGISNFFQTMKSNTTTIKKEDIAITFKDAAGVDKAKKEIMDLSNF